MQDITIARDETGRDDGAATEDAPIYYRFGVASNLRRRVITTLPPIKSAETARVGA